MGKDSTCCYKNLESHIAKDVAINGGWGWADLVLLCNLSVRCGASQGRKERKVTALPPSLRTQHTDNSLTLNPSPSLLLT